MSRRYGWRPSPPDPRDWPPEKLEQMIESGLAEPVPALWDTPVTLDQGNTGHCVGFAGATFVASANAYVGITTGVDNALGHELYYAAKIHDNDGPENLETGSTLRSLAKVLKERGYIDGYSLTADFDAIDRWVGSRGGVVCGLYWYEGMKKPDSKGLVKPTGAKLGGHAICCRGKDQPVMDNVFRNSWGKRWGKDGECGMSDITLRYLYEQQGEALLMVKLSGLAWPWRDGKDLVISDDDAKSIAAAYDGGKGALIGYPDRTFRPHDPVTQHQVNTVMRRLGLLFAHRDRVSDWVTPATRAWVHERFPELDMRDGRMDENCTRYQLLLMVGRYVRGV